MDDGRALVLASRGLEEVKQGQPLTVRVRVNYALVGGNSRRRNGTWCRPNLRTQIVAGKVLPNTLKRQKEERFVTSDGSTDRPAVLLAMKIPERLAIFRVRGQAFQSLEIERTAMHLV